MPRGGRLYNLHLPLNVTHLVTYGSIEGQLLPVSLKYGSTVGQLSEGNSSNRAWQGGDINLMSMNPCNPTQWCCSKNVVGTGSVQCSMV